MTKRSIGAYKKAQKATTVGLSRHALTMKIYKEIVKNLEVCNYLFDRKKELQLCVFLAKKGETLGKVQKYTSYMLTTMNREAEPETVELYERMYVYILENAKQANSDMDHEAVKRALYMSNELVEIWDSIPENIRY
ncbi:conserved hypothetical protein [Vibrio chagasii]|nr:conserved hypothetical protein [Vibrio chagasii]